MRRVAESMIKAPTNLAKRSLECLAPPAATEPGVWRSPQRTGRVVCY
jgi:hypothetical protein